MFTKKQEERFIKRIIKLDNGCWEHTCSECRINKIKYKVGRVSWIINFGDIPDGYDVCKKCKNRKCVNPRHLYLEKNTIDKRPLVDRFWEKVDIKSEDECWEWTGRKLDDGYGLINENGIQYRAHRLSYEVNNGMIDDGMVIRHTCNNPKCVNPKHLVQGTHKQNSEDMVAAGHSQFGTKNTNSVLNDELVKEIREIYATKKHSYKSIGFKFNVSEATIGQIIRRDTWKHVL